MYRYKLKEIGVGNKVRVLAQYQHIKYGRLLLVNVYLLDDYITIENDCNSSIDMLTDHVYLDISESDDKRLTEFRELGDIIICTCEIYQYEYINCYDKDLCGSDINFALKNPTDIVLLKPLVYDDKLVFLPQPDGTEISFYRYIGKGSRSCMPSDWWDFSKLLTLPEREYLHFGEASIVTHKGYEITNETDVYLDLLYAEHDNKITVYKSIKSYLEYVGFERSEGSEERY